MAKFQITFEYRDKDVEEVKKSLTDLFTLDAVCECFNFETTVLKIQILKS
jgi:hypothetical protein